MNRTPEQEAAFVDVELLNLRARIIEMGVAAILTEAYTLAGESMVCSQMLAEAVKLRQDAKLRFRALVEAERRQKESQQNA